MLIFALKAVFVPVLGIRVAVDANWSHEVMPLLKAGLGRKAHLGRSCLHFWSGSPFLCSEGFLGNTLQGELQGILVVLVHCPLNILSSLLLLLWTIPDEALEMFWEASPWSLCSSPELGVQASTHSPSPEQAGETTSYGSASRIPFTSFCSFLAILGLASGDKDHQPSPTQHLMPLLAL